MRLKSLAPAMLAAITLAATVGANAALARSQARARAEHHSSRPLAAATTPVKPAPQAVAETIVTDIALADLGFKNGIRLANLGARREVFVPLPEGADLKLTELTLIYDDLTAYKARRYLEVLVNDRTVAAVPLEGSGAGRRMQVSLASTTPHDGFVKVAFLYSGAATPDRCIDVRYVGDSLTIRPETAVAVAFDGAGLHDVTTIAALMPRDVTIALPDRALSPAEISAALTVARALNATGRRPLFRSRPAEQAETRDGEGRVLWTRGTIAIGAPVTGAVPGVAGGVPGDLSAIRIDGMPALLLSDVTTAMRAARLLATPSLAAARGLSQVQVADVGLPHLPHDRITFDQLGLRPPPVEVYGRAELNAALDTRMLPANTRPSRLRLDVLVAPDGAGDKAVLSLFINGRFLASTVAANGEPTRIEQSLPEGLVGTVANINVVVQRRSAAGDCRFLPQGYPAQILASSVVELSPAGTPHDFADITTLWTDGVDVMLPAQAARQPQGELPLLAEVLSALSPAIAPVTVKFAAPAAAPAAPFIAVSATAPQGAAPTVRFDRGRVAVKNRSGQTLLDLGGFRSGAVAQLVEAGSHPGVWIKPLADDGRLPAPADVRLDHGDVAFIDKTGVALAMSTQRDTLLLITYPDQTSWATISSRLRPWIVGTLWLLATIVFLFALQRMLRRRQRVADE